MKNVFVLAILAMSLIGCSKDEATNPGTTNNLPAEFKALHGIFDGTGIGASVNIADDIILFFSTDGTRYAWFENQEIKVTEPLSKEGGLFDGLAFSTIGAAIDYDEERLVFFNTIGGTYQWVGINPDQVAGNTQRDTLLKFESNTFSLFEWGVDNSCPFQKIGALFGFNKEAAGCQMIEDDDLYLWMANDDGDEVTRYVKATGLFDSTSELELWRAQNVCGGSPAIFPMPSIGASCIYEPDGEIYREIFFNSAGTKFTILTPSTGTYTEVFDLQ